MVLGVGGNVSQGILKSLAASSLETRVVAGCISPTSLGLYRSDVAYLTPRADDPGFAGWMLETCERESIDAILSGLSVSVETSTEILDIGYTSQDPATAQRFAQAFADSYLKFRKQHAVDEIQVQVDGVKADVASVTDQITTSEHKLATTTDPVTQSGLETQLQAARARLGVLQQKLDDLSNATALQSAGEVVQPAEIPTSRSDAGPIQIGALALVLGLALGIGLAFLRERMDDRLRGRDDFERHLGAPVLAVIPKVPNWRDKNKPKLVTFSESKSAASEAYRTLRTSLMFMANQRPLQVILMASAAAGEGKTTTSANLAVAFAQAGKKVVLLGADLRKPRIHRFFGMDNSIGLVDTLSGEIALAQAVQRTGVPDLEVLQSGRVPASPAEMLQSDQMGEVLAELRRRFDFVIIDSAPALIVSDALALAPIVDGVVFIAESERSTRQAVSRARDQLEQVGALIVGGVLNNYDPQRARGGRYYYRYYRYGYQQTPTRGERGYGGGFAGPVDPGGFAPRTQHLGAGEADMGFAPPREQAPSSYPKT